MIVATHFGMFMPALRPDWVRCINAGEPELQVRSRRKIDLMNLRQLAQENDILLGEVIQLPNTDYQFRAYCTRQAWGELMTLMALDIDYVKFKDTPQKKHGDTKLKQAYEAMWSAVFRVFPTGSVYDYSSGHRGNKTYWANHKVASQPGDRIAETVYRTETREWRMKGASSAELADLMREIDAATDGVQAPSDEELEQLALVMTDPYDHSRCSHSDTKTARRKCRQRRRLQG